MRPVSQTLHILVSKTAMHLRGSAATDTDASELERRLHGAIGELQRSRPRLVEFAPRRALQRALASPAFRDAPQRLPRESTRLAGAATLR